MHYISLIYNTNLCQRTYIYYCPLRNFHYEPRFSDFPRATISDIMPTIFSSSAVQRLREREPRWVWLFVIGSLAALIEIAALVLFAGPIGLRQYGFYTGFDYFCIAAVRRRPGSCGGVM